MGIEKVISGGRAGAERAALDVAISLGVASGGWFVKSRPTRDHRLSTYYRLKEMPTASHSAQTANNVLFSDATLIVSRGVFSNGPDLVTRVAALYRRPVLHVDLRHRSTTDAAGLMKSWIKMNHVKTLNVTGPTTREDSRIYDDTQFLLKRFFLLMRPGVPRQPAASSRKKRDVDAADAIDDIIAALPLKQRVAIANMGTVDLAGVQGIFDQYVLKGMDGDPDDDDASDLIETLWHRLRETYTLRVVK